MVYKVNGGGERGIRNRAASGNQLPVLLTDRRSAGEFLEFEIELAEAAQFILRLGETGREPELGNPHESGSLVLLKDRPGSGRHASHAFERMQDGRKVSCSSP